MSKSNSREIVEGPYAMKGFTKADNVPTQVHELEHRTKQLLRAAFKGTPLRQLPRGINARIGEYLDDWNTEKLQKLTEVDATFRRRLREDIYYTFHPLIGGFVSAYSSSRIGGSSIMPHSFHPETKKGYGMLYPSFYSRRPSWHRTDFNKVNTGIDGDIKGLSVPENSSSIIFNPYFKHEEQRAEEQRDNKRTRTDEE